VTPLPLTKRLFIVKELNIIEACIGSIVGEEKSTASYNVKVLTKFLVNNTLSGTESSCF
jgi:hypothetical protein